MSRPPLPPFDAETAAQKARMAEDAWNTRETGGAVAPRLHDRQQVAEPRRIPAGPRPRSRRS